MAGRARVGACSGRWFVAPLPSREGFRALREQGGRVSWLEAAALGLPGRDAQWPWLRA